MFKKNITIASGFFVLHGIKDWFSNENIQWEDNIIFSVIVFVVYGIWEWTKEPYDWNKNKDPQ